MVENSVSPFFDIKRILYIIMLEIWISVLFIISNYPQMEQTNCLDTECKTNKKRKHLSIITVDHINHTLEHPTEEFEIRIDNILKKMINVSTKNLDATPESQREFFNQTCRFLNTTFSNVHIKKFYNTAPIYSLNSYEKMSLWHQATHNIYGKERQLFYRKQIWWWSCHHWTIFLDKLFEKLKEKWLQVKNHIALYSAIEWHSMVIVEFQWEKYCADVFGDHDDTVIRKIDKKDRIYPEKELYKRKEIEYFSDTKLFAEHIENKPYEDIRITFKPKLGSDCCDEINIDIDCDAILVSVDGKSYRSFLKNIVIPKKLHKAEVIDYIIQNSTWDRKAKQEISKYLDIVRKKINIDKLMTLFKTK